MTTTEITAEQNSPEWYQARCGLITASNFGVLFMKGRGGAPSETRKKLLRRLAGERITGQPEETYSNARMQDGHEKEIDAAEWYAFQHDAEIRECGFFKSDECGGCGASPDRLIGDSGVLEIKSHIPSVLIEKIETGKMYTPAYFAQVQGQLWLTSRDYCDFLPYWPGMPKRICKIIPDREFIAGLKSEVRRFNDELEELVERVIEYGAENVG